MRISALVVVAMALAATTSSAQTIEPYKAHDIEVYKSHTIEPVKPAQTPQVDQENSRQERRGRTGCGPSVAPRGGTNLVEPLSNGMSLSWNDEQIKTAFGQPTDPTWDARTYGYPGISIQVGGQGPEIWSIRLTRTGCVTMHSGIGPGSTRAQVMQVFGKADTFTYDQYKLEFRYSGDRVYDISISPAELRGFHPVRGNSTVNNGRRSDDSQSQARNNNDGQNHRKKGFWDRMADSMNQQNTANQQKQSGQQEQQPTSNSSGMAGKVVGKWYCSAPSATVGNITIRPNGTYDFNGQAGRWRIEGSDIVFSNIPWNNGHADFDKYGNIEFYWRSSGGINYFAFSKY